MNISLINFVHNDEWWCLNYLHIQLNNSQILALIYYQHMSHRQYSSERNIQIYHNGKKFAIYHNGRFTIFIMLGRNKKESYWVVWWTIQGACATIFLNFEWHMAIAWDSYRVFFHTRFCSQNLKSSCRRGKLPLGSSKLSIHLHIASFVFFTFPI